MNFSRARKLLKKMKRILILMHSSPDIDAIGSAYALLLRFLAQGKEAYIGIEGPIPSRYSFFLDSRIVEKHFRYYQTLKPANIDWIVCVDTSDPALLGSFRSFVADPEKVLVIDHHTTFFPYGNYCLNDPQSSSTCEMVFDLFKGKLPDRETALSLYAGMVYDTGNFRYPSTSGNLLRKAAGILDQFSLDTEEIFYSIFENESLERKKLISLIISTIETYAEGEAVVSYFPLTFKKQLNLDESDTSGLVRVGHSVKGCLFSVFIKEKEDGIYFSFRSRTGFNVAELAQRWGGGGHRLASGLKMEDTTLEYVRKDMVPVIIEDFRKWRKDNA
jgi:phosphoesterase RecJ-like protein